MRHIETPDPVVRELRALRREVKLQRVATVVLFVTLAFSFAAALWLRGRDLEEFTRRGNEEQVTTCFRQANQRADVRIALGRLLFSSDVPAEFVDPIRTLLLILPTVKDCRKLADDLNVNSRENT